MLEKIKGKGALAYVERLERAFTGRGTAFLKMQINVV